MRIGRPTRSCSSGTDCTSGAPRSPTRCVTSRFSSSCSRRWGARRRIDHAEDTPHTEATEETMALLKIPDEDRTITDASAVRDFLAERGIHYERTGAAPGVTSSSTADEILSAWAPKIDELKA